MSNSTIQQFVQNAPFPHDTSGRYVGWLADQIRRRAYEIYQARGDSPGTAEGDWLQAERELKNHFGL
jgi:hypothetical protein